MESRFRGLVGSRKISVDGDSRDKSKLFIVGDSISVKMSKLMMILIDMNILPMKYVGKKSKKIGIVKLFFFTGKN